MNYSCGSRYTATVSDERLTYLVVVEQTTSTMDPKRPFVDLIHCCRVEMMRRRLDMYLTNVRFGSKFEMRNDVDESWTYNGEK